MTPAMIEAAIKTVLSLALVGLWPPHTRVPLAPAPRGRARAAALAPGRQNGEPL